MSGLSAARRASVADTGFAASASALDVNASGCSRSPRNRIVRWAEASAGGRRLMSISNDFEIALHLPVGPAVLPLPPFPFARRREVLDEVVAEPVARDLGIAENARGLDQRTWRTCNVLRALVRAVDRLGGELKIALD